MNASLPTATLREHSGENMTFVFRKQNYQTFPSTDRCNKEGRKVRVLYNTVMRNTMMPFSQRWKERGGGFESINTKRQEVNEKITCFIFADSCYVVTATKKELEIKMKEATWELTSYGLEWKEEAMEHMSWGEDGQEQ